METGSKKTLSRRTFVTAAASATAVSCATTYAKKTVPESSNNKLNVAIIGAGGRGRSDLKGMTGENLVAICDVDLVRAADSIAANPKAKVYLDFRKMFDEMHKEIDAVVVATPDHTHYVAAMAAMEHGKHVYCEKPLAHSIYEVRKLMEKARECGVATQMGNQGHSSEHIRLCCEWIRDGAIGDVREVHAWSDRPFGGYPFPGSMARPAATPPVPDTMEWDLWLGPAQYRDYHPAYAPIYWRAWLDYGTGPLGDMGCHILDPAFWALDLGSPVSVEANVSYNVNPEFWMPRFDGTDGLRADIPAYMEALKRETYPTASVVRYEFPARKGMPPVKLTWFDGGIMPPRPADLSDDKDIGANGAFLLGENGTIAHGSHGAGGCRIIPETRMKDYAKNLPDKTIPRVEGHHADWLNACKGGNPSCANFDYGGALTEMVLLGVIAMRVNNKKLKWDAKKMEFTNSDEANAFVKPIYRKGWTL